MATKVIGHTENGSRTQHVDSLRDLVKYIDGLADKIDSITDEEFDSNRDDMQHMIHIFAIDRPSDDESGEVVVMQKSSSYCSGGFAEQAVSEIISDTGMRGQAAAINAVMGLMAGEHEEAETAEQDV